jgi:hypothetical protein
MPALNRGPPTSNQIVMWSATKQMALQSKG